MVLKRWYDLSKSNRLALIAFVFFSTIIHLSAQIKSKEISVYLGTSVALNFKTGSNAFKENFPGIKAFVGFNSSNVLKLFKGVDGSVNLGSSITIYNKSLGNSLNLGFQDNQIDWTNNITIGCLWGENTDLRLLQTINNSPFYNLQHRSKYAFHIGSNFIMNNYKRHQTNGTVSFTIDRFSMTYYNDGGPIMSWIGIGDGFDRYWTGGLKLYYHDHRQEDTTTVAVFNRVEASFDQFTGYKPQMYEFTTMFAADVQDYDLYQYFNPQDSSVLFSVNRDKRIGYDFNASEYKININFDETVGGSIGMIGSLRNLKNEQYFALQDILHVLTDVAIHPNKDTNRLTLGFNYNNRVIK
jgi:hypothetical protein